MLMEPFCQLLSVVLCSALVTMHLLQGVCLDCCLDRGDCDSETESPLTAEVNFHRKNQQELL